MARHGAARRGTAGHGAERRGRQGNGAMVRKTERNQGGTKMDEDNEKCKHCGGLINVRNPTGHCDHLYWPDMLTPEAKKANGYTLVKTESWQKEEK
jgi:hypothetical protein